MTLEWTEELDQELRAQADISGDLATTLQPGQLAAVLLELDRRAERINQLEDDQRIADGLRCDLRLERAAADRRIAELERGEVALRESIEALTTKLTTVTRERDDLLLEHVRHRAGPTAEEERAATTRRRGRGRR